jgi:hypothetical protein
MSKPFPSMSSSDFPDLPARVDRGASAVVPIQRGVAWGGGRLVAPASALAPAPKPEIHAGEVEQLGNPVDEPPERVAPVTEGTPDIDLTRMFKEVESEADAEGHAPHQRYIVEADLDPQTKIRVNAEFERLWSNPANRIEHRKDRSYDLTPEQFYSRIANAGYKTEYDKINQKSYWSNLNINKGTLLKRDKVYIFNEKKYIVKNGAEIPADRIKALDILERDLEANRNKTLGYQYTFDEYPSLEFKNALSRKHGNINPQHHGGKKK